MSEPERAIDVQTAPPPALRARTYHMHDGFYLRLATGLGPQWTRFDSFFRDSNWWGLSFDVQIGGTPARGLVVGGGLWLAAHSAANAFSIYDADPDRTNFLAILVGPMLDFFPNPKHGFHLGGAIGLGKISIASDAIGKGQGGAGGFGGAFWIGNDFWVGPDWSLGAQARLLTVRGRNSDADYRARSTSLALMFTVLYH